MLFLLFHIILGNGGTQGSGIILFDNKVLPVIWNSTVVLVRIILTIKNFNF